MRKLAGRDFRVLSEFLQRNYALVDFPALTSHILQGLPRLIPSALTTYNEMDVTRRISRDWTEPKEIANAERVRVWQVVMHEHPVLAHFARTGDTRAHKLSDFLTRSQFHRLALYNEHFGPQGIEHMIGLGLSCAPNLVVGIGLHRDRRDFSERERLLLNLLRPHLFQAWRNVQAISPIPEDFALACRVAEALDYGLVSVDRVGRVELITTRAVRWLTTYFGSRSGWRGSLPQDLKRWVRHQETLLHRPSAVPSARQPLILEREGRHLVVRLISTPGGPLLVLEEEQTVLDPSCLECLGLGRRESEVLGWVAQGKTNIEVGLILGRSPRTVQKHLERIYRKLGVETRTGAAMVAMQTAVRRARAGKIPPPEP